MNGIPIPTSSASTGVRRHLRPGWALLVAAAFLAGVVVGELPGAVVETSPVPGRDVSTAMPPGLAAAVGGAVTGTHPAGPAEAPGRGRGESIDEPEGFEAFWEALRIVRQEYVDEAALAGPNLTQGAIRGMVESLGDTGHTVYLAPEEVQAERDALNGRVTGIGVVVDDRAWLPLVISVIDGSPADRAGLRPGDLIVSVDGVEVRRMGAGELITRVRGPAGTTLRLGIERRDQPGMTEFDMVREQIVVPAVGWAMVPGTSVAHVRLVQFSSGAARALREALGEALSAGATGLVLDLRGNPGGLVGEATSVAGAFMASGTAYRQQGRDGDVARIPVRGRTLVPDLPLAVLVDYGSASSAEIVAAALRDNGRAVLIGEQTFGTGTVLGSFDLSDGSSLRVAVVRWLTPDGESIFRVGVTPDEVVARLPGAMALEPSDLLDATAREFAASGDLQLRRAVDVVAGDTAHADRSAAGGLGRRALPQRARTLA